MSRRPAGAARADPAAARGELRRHRRAGGRAGRRGRGRPRQPADAAGSGQRRDHAAGAARGRGAATSRPCAAAARSSSSSTPAAPPRCSSGSRADERTEIVRGMGERERDAGSCPSCRPRCARRSSGCCCTRRTPRAAIMTTEFVRLAPGMTVGECLQAHPRGRAREGVDLRLLRDGAGHRPAAGLGLAARPGDGRAASQPVDEGHARASRSRSAPATTRRLVAQKIAKYNLLAVPVLEEDGSVVGFVTVDDVIDVMIEEQTEDILQHGRRRAGRPRQAVLRRTRSGASCASASGWLLLLFVGETLTGTVLRHFEEELARRWCSPSSSR